MYHIIANPIAGRKKSKKAEIYLKIKNYLDENKIEYKWYETEYYLHPTKIASEIEEKYQFGDIIVLGGDGTLNEVINGLKNPKNFNIGLVPLGSGNDFAKALGLNPKKPFESFTNIIDKDPSKVDYILVNNKKMCVNVLGTGIDVLVLKKFEQYKKLKGSFRYFVALISALFTFKWYEFDLSIDGGEFVHKKGFMVGLCNGQTIGGGIPICPSAKISDGKLEIVFVNQIKRIQMLPYLISLMSKKILNKKATEHIYCEKAIFRDSKNLEIQIDGNIVNDTKEYHCEIVKDGMNFYKGE